MEGNTYSDRNFEIKEEYRGEPEAERHEPRFERDFIDELLEERDEIAELESRFGPRRVRPRAADNLPIWPFALILAFPIFIILGTMINTSCPRQKPLTQEETWQTRETPSLNLRPPESRAMNSSLPTLNPNNQSEKNSRGRSGSKDEGAAAPSFFQWTCVQDRLECSIYSQGQLLQTFTSDGKAILTNKWTPGLPTPNSWGCGLNEARLDCDISDGRGNVLQKFLYDGKVYTQEENRAESSTMGGGAENNAGDLSGNEAIRGGRPYWVSGYAENHGEVWWIPDVSSGCYRVKIAVPAGGTASVHRTTSRGAPLDTLSGPAIFVLPEDFCVETGGLNFCGMCSNSSQVSPRLQLDDVVAVDAD